jgi:hypothetical protein
MHVSVHFYWKTHDAHRERGCLTLACVVAGCPGARADAVTPSTPAESKCCRAASGVVLFTEQRDRLSRAAGLNRGAGLLPTHMNGARPSSSAEQDAG